MMIEKDELYPSSAFCNTAPGNKGYISKAVVTKGLFGEDTRFLPMKFARIGAHEAAHYFLKTIIHSGGMLSDSVAVEAYLGWPDKGALFQFSPEQAKQLSRLCNEIDFPKLAPIESNFPMGMGQRFGWGSFRLHELINIGSPPPYHPPPRVAPLA